MTYDLITKDLKKTLITFTFPIMLSLLLQICYSTVDLLIVGIFSDISNVSAVTIGSQVMHTVTQFVAGLATGATVLIGKYIGLSRKEDISKIVGSTIVLFTCFALILTIFLIAFNGNIIEIMKTPDESFEYAKSYLLITSIGSTFIIAYNVLGSIFRGIGDSKTPLITVAIACITNIILDLILVAFFDMGASGAAIATTFSQALSVYLSIIFVKNKELPFKFNKKILTFSKELILELLKLGMPIALQGILVSSSFLVITALINEFGVEASAAVGIGEKISGIIMIVPMAFMQSLSAFTAQNIGANNIKRAVEGLKFSMITSVIFGIIMAYLAFFNGEIFTRLFTSDTETTRLALMYLKSYAFDCILVAFLFCFTGFFSGISKTTFVMLQSVLAAFFLRIPLAILLSGLENTNLFIIGLGTPLATSVQVLVCFVFYFKTLKNINTLVK